MRPAVVDSFIVVIGAVFVVVVWQPLPRALLLLLLLLMLAMVRMFNPRVADGLRT